MNRSKTLQLYRGLIRASKLFLIESRKERCLSQHLLGNFKKQFRDNKNLTDSKEISNQITQANNNYNVLKDLLENKYIQKYPCSVRVRPIVVSKSNYLLSTKSQKTIKAKKWGFLDRLRIVFGNENEK
ncbi:hypothetical protein DLAC_00220 [Tieghemostelium lacteum]|uniref:LYR motif-containing protein 4 n=1 Tax=Tieghemostelium lacteum TaxID=361077 RepID=A0A152A9M0_TIELA|nr:hypothetical protein DLAC_00220 [Tieghemostelium lacteum]|eukprot:KYR02757.1 hypothetical protein DLAC_00220 [Tieghemostelium lacteum]